MKESKLIEEVKAARDEFDALLDEVDEAKRRYYRGIQRLYEAGMPLREIADAVGLSHQRVHQIVGDASLGRRVSRKIAKHARAGGAAGAVILLFLSGWIVSAGGQQSRADAEAELRPALELLETELPGDAGETLSSKLEVLFEQQR
jgi:hypothetical protein